MLWLHGHRSRGLAPWQPSHKLPATSQNISPCDAARNKCAEEAAVEGLVMIYLRLHNLLSDVLQTNIRYYMYNIMWIKRNIIITFSDKHLKDRDALFNLDIAVIYYRFR